MESANNKQPVSNIQLLQTETESGNTVDLIEVVYRLLASWKLLVILTLVCALLGGLYSKYLVTPTYKATSTIYVLSNKESVINMSDLQIGSALTNDYIKVFSMWEVHEQVKQNLKLDYTYATMRSMLGVSNSNGTRMLDISFTSTDPQEAADVANEYARVGSQYIADTMSMDKPSIMSTALKPTIPTNASLIRNVLLGAVLGFLVAAAFVVIRFLMDDKIRTADDVLKYTGMVNLSAIPLENNQKGGNEK